MLQIVIEVVFSVKAIMEHTPFFIARVCACVCVCICVRVFFFSTTELL